LKSATGQGFSDVRPAPPSLPLLGSSIPLHRFLLFSIFGFTFFIFLYVLVFVYYLFAGIYYSFFCPSYFH
jgi:hypothetical protein